MGHVSNRTSRIVASIIFFTLMWQSSAHGQQEQANGKLETASSTDGNLILNGGFDSNEAWQLQIHKGKGGVATLHFDHAARIVREKGGDAIWAIQLIQKSLRLKAKHRYRVSFRTRAENTTGFDFQVCKAGKPNLSYSKPESVNVTKDWAKIEHEFSMGDTADPAAKIAFSLGKGTGTIFLDDIRLEELGAADPADETASQKSKWIPDDVIKNLELEVSKREAINKPTNEQRLDLKDFEFKLDVAKYFEKQLVDTSLTNVATLENQKEKVDASDGDTFVIVKIKVPKKSQVAQIEFANFTGVAKCTTNLYYFAKGDSCGALSRLSNSWSILRHKDRRRGLGRSTKTIRRPKERTGPNARLYSTTCKTKEKPTTRYHFSGVQRRRGWRKWKFQYHVRLSHVRLVPTVAVATYDN